MVRKYRVSSNALFCALNLCTCLGDTYALSAFQAILALNLFIRGKYG